MSGLWLAGVLVHQAAAQNADMRVTASGSPNPVGAGSNVTYTLQVNNLGTNTATAAILTNSLPPGFTFVSANISVTGAATQQVNVIHTNNTVWRYDDTGTNYGTAWRDSVYNDSGWLSGRSALAQEDTAQIRIPTNTVLRLTNSAGAKFITYYFRTGFSYTNSLTNTSLRLFYQVDDGLVMYLNGSEIHRFNMPTSAVTSASGASTAFGEGTLVVTNISVTNLISGSNVVAVEVHQNNTNSSDVYFGLGVDVLVITTPASYTVNGRDVTVQLGNMANGSAATVTIVAKSGTAGSATNMAGVTSSNPDPNPTNNTAQVVTTVNPPPAAELSLGIADFPDPIQVGNNLTYTLFITNSGALAANNVVITNLLPANVTFVSATFSNVGYLTQAVSVLEMTNEWRYDTNGVDLGSNWVTSAFDDTAWPSGPGLLGNENNTAITINTQLPINYPAGGNIPTIYFRTTFDYTGPLTNVSAVLRSIIDDAAVVYLNGKEIWRSANMGTGTITFTNQATSAANEGVIVTNQLTLTNLVTGTNLLAVEVHQSGTASSDLVFGLALSLLNITRGAYTLNGNELILQLGNLAAASQAAAVVVVTPTAGGTITDSATVTSSSSENNLANNSASATTSVSLTPVDANLSLTMADSPDPIIQGQNLTYTLSVVNAGPAPATGVRLTNSLPANVTVVSVAPGCAQVGNLVICDLGSLPVNGQSNLTFVIRPSSVGNITNAALVAANEPDSIPFNNVALAVTTVETSLRSDLNVTMQFSPNAVVAGDLITNLVAVFNAGPSNATGVVLTNRLQGAFTINAVRINGPGTFNNLGGGVVVCQLGALASGASVSVAIEMTATVVGGITNTANVKAAELDPGAANNLAVNAARVNAAPVVDLVVTTAAPASVYGGGSFDYTITVNNTGTLTATGVMFTNLLSPAVTLVSFTNSQGVCSNVGGLLIGNLGTLAGGQTATVLIRVTTPASGVLTNIAGALAQGDFNLLDNISVAQTVVIPNTAADLELTVNPSATNLYAGEELVYRLVLVNHGPTDATGVLITNRFPAGVTYLRGNVTAGTFYSIPGALVFSLPGLPRDATLQASIVVRVDAAGSLTNLAVAVANQSDPTPNVVQTVVRALPAADLQVTATQVTDPITSTAVETYTITAQNYGPSTASNAVLYCYLPFGSTFQGALASRGSFTTNNGAIIWNLGNLVAGANATMEIDLVIGALGTAVTSVGIYANEYDPVTTNNTVVFTTSILSGYGAGIVVSPSTNANALAAALAGSGSGIKVNSVKLLANRSEGATSSGIYYIAATNNYQLNAPGVILSTGDVADYGSGTNTDTGFSTSYGRAANVEQEGLLDPITGRGTNNYNHYDVTQLDINFDMIGGFDRVTFKVVFGSDEYPEYVDSAYIDGFGIYLDGTNIAFAAGAPVNINHPAMSDVPETELDGVIFLGGTSAVMTFTAPVPAASLNHKLTFIIADTSDSVFDTTVYISSLEGISGANADLGVAASVTPEPVRVGDLLTYSITVTNIGPNTATNAVLTGVLPLLLTNISVTVSGTYSISNGIVTCNLGNLARRASTTVTVRGYPSFDARFVTTFSVASALTDLAGGNNSTSIVSTAVDLGSFYNPNGITIRDGAVALPYPAIITVAGLTGVVSKITVTLIDLSHTFPADINALLVAPDGRNAILMAAVGGSFAMDRQSLQFDDAATLSLPGNQPIVAGIYKPTNLAPTNYFPGVTSLVAPIYGATLAAVRRANPNGDWKLYLYDNQGGDAGVVAGGWNIKITTAPEMTVVVSGGNIIVSWHDLPDYILEGTSALSNNPLWTTVNQAQTVSNGRRTVIVPMSLGLKYFRLRK